MKHITKISLMFIALTLAMSASAATQYCEKEVASAPGTGSLLFTASKTGTSETTFTITSTETTFDALNAEGALYNVAAQNLGGGVTSTVWNKGWTLENNTLKKVVEWTTYPSQPIQLYIVARDSKDIIGATFTDIDVSVSCDGSGDSGDSGESTVIESNYCQKELTGTIHSKQITMTCTKESEGNYKIVITGENLNGLGGSWVYINNNATYNLGTNLSSSSTTEIVCNIASTTDPRFYTPLYVKYKEGSAQPEEAFSTPSDIIWGTCSATPEPIYTSISDAICFGETYTWNGQTYSTTGEYTQEFTAVNGADSIVTLTLTVHPQTSNTTEDVTIDFGETYTWNNQEYTETGTYTITLQDANGCDYQATLNLTVNSNSPSTPSTCTYEGGPGDALLEQPGQDQFESGYRITLTLDEADTDKIHITATVLGSDAPAETAYFQNYPYYDYAQNTAEHKFPGSKQSTFETTISISSLLKDNIADGIIRFAIKFEYDGGGIKVTTPEFFYLDGSGCAQRVFAIYHHDDLPATPLEGEDQFTEFAGGRILQSIQYKRRMPSEVWETLFVPFEVDRVTAFDPATGEHVPLYAQYNHNGATKAGHYWLRYFKTSPVTRTEFQSNWHDIEADNQEAAKPEKNKAYIIRLPNGGGYYNDKYIVFHGKGYQTIASEYDIPTAPADNYFSYSGNNTMKPQPLKSAYVLDNAGYYFTSSSTVTLPPFECSVNATAATIAKMPRIALNGRNNTTTDLTLLPTTDLQGGVIYSIFGAAVARFNTIDEYDQACQTLAAGVYVVVTPSATTKIQIP